MPGRRVEHHRGVVFSQFIIGVDDRDERRGCLSEASIPRASDSVRSLVPNVANTIIIKARDDRHSG